MIKLSGQLLQAWNFRRIWISSQNLLCHKICVYTVTRHLIAFSTLSVSHSEQKNQIRHLPVFTASEAQ